MPNEVGGGGKRCLGISRQGMGAGCGSRRHRREAAVLVPGRPEAESAVAATAPKSAEQCPCRDAVLPAPLHLAGNTCGATRQDAIYWQCFKMRNSNQADTPRRGIE